ncbi:hypothetical protein V6000_006173 [Aspergillus fumigatus]
MFRQTVLIKQRNRPKSKAWAGRAHQTNYSVYLQLHSASLAGETRESQPSNAMQPLDRTSSVKAYTQHHKTRAACILDVEADGRDPDCRVTTTGGAMQLSAAAHLPCSATTCYFSYT